MTFCRFLVKSLGKAEAKGLWGIKHTRKPVDEMVTAARSVTHTQCKPVIKFTQPRKCPFGRLCTV